MLFICFARLIFLYANYIESICISIVIMSLPTTNCHKVNVVLNLGKKFDGKKKKILFGISFVNKGFMRIRSNKKLYIESDSCLIALPVRN